jgi:hypothetical protein
MGRYKIKDRKTIASLIGTSTGFLATIAALIVGGIFLAKQRPKVLNYAHSMCQVISRAFKSYVCRLRTNKYTCYGPIWEVHHGDNRTVYALVETEKRYRYYLDALNNANEYQVRMAFDSELHSLKSI